MEIGTDGTSESRRRSGAVEKQVSFLRELAPSLALEDAMHDADDPRNPPRVDAAGAPDPSDDPVQDPPLDRAAAKAIEERAEQRDHTTLGEELGEATGGISGVLLGAGIGSAAGPVGTLIGGVAGALGGWWAGRAVADAARSLTDEDDEYFRTHYRRLPDRRSDQSYDDVRGAYYLGQIASHNPNFRARQFEDIEPLLEEGWTRSAEQYGDWTTVRPFAREGFTRGQSKLDEHARRARADHEARTRAERRDGRDGRDGRD